MARAMATDEVSWPAKSKLRIKSRICSVERFECFKTQFRRSSSSKLSFPSWILFTLSSIFPSMNFSMVDLDCETLTNITGLKIHRCQIREKKKHSLLLLLSLPLTPFGMQFQVDSMARIPPLS